MSRYRLTFSLLVLLFTSAGYSASSPVEAPAAFSPTPREYPEKGLFLVANREMLDPRFRQSVIFIVDHNEEGTLGLIINRPSGVSLVDILPQLDSENARQNRLFFGGPVAINRLLFLTQNETVPAEEAFAIVDDIYSSGDMALLEALSNRKTGEELRIYFGHAGWAPNQLDAELDRNGWQLFQTEPASIVFHRQPETLWEMFIKAGNESQIFVQGRKPELLTILFNL